MRLGRSNLVLLGALLIGFNCVAFVLVQLGNSSLQKGDFKMFYSAAIALRSGHAGELYSQEFHASRQRLMVPLLSPEDVKVYTHPPYELLVLLPLSLLPYKAACYCWLAITVLLAVFCGRLLAGYLAVLGLFPLLATLLQQQDSVLVLLIVIGCWSFLRKGEDASAGFLLGIALFRFQIVIPLALLLMFWKPRLTKGFVLSATLVSLVSLAMVGPAGLRSYMSYVSGMARESVASVNEHYKMDPRTNPTVRGLVYEFTSLGRESLSLPAASLVAVSLGILDMLCVFFGWRFMRGDAAAELKFAFAILLAILLSFHLLMHDLVLLALPFVLLRGLRARWLLIPFYVAPLVYWFYPHSQVWLALLLVCCCGLIVFDESKPGLTVAEEVHLGGSGKSTS